MSKHHYYDRSKPTVIAPPVSTGPTSDAGKAIAARNATKHGCCSTKTLILATENPADFATLQAAWLHTYGPQENELTELHLVHLLVEADWFLQRATRTAAEVEAQLFTAVPNPLEWTEDHHKKLARFLRYQTTRTNLVTKARKAVEDYRRNRDMEDARIQRLAHKDERLALAKQKLEVYKECHPPVLTLDQEMDQLRLKAIEMGYINADGSSTGKREAEDAAFEA